MKTIISLLFLLFGSIFVFAQTDNISRKKSAAITKNTVVPPKTTYRKSVPATKKKHSTINNNVKLLSGYSSITNDDGSTYVGNFSDGQFCGQGKYTFPDGMSIEGVFANSAPNGKCTITQSDGFVFYDGNMVDGEIKGHGIKFLTDSLYIEGEWLDNGEKASEAIVADVEGNILFNGSIKNETSLDRGLLYNGYQIDQGYFTDNGWVSEMVLRDVDVQEDRVVFNIYGVPLIMIKVEAGAFIMGATSEMKTPLDTEKPTHQVTLTKNYYIGQTEVTQALWQAVMGNNPSKFKGNNKPVECVSWNDCKTFMTKLNSFTGLNFRLPTEAEWEFAARGGNISKHYKYSGSSKLDEVAWYGKSEWSTHDVAAKKPNELGIYDMTGNVWEWCEDWFGNYSSSAQTNPKGPNSGDTRVFRGGSWDFYARGCRSSCRNGDAPDVHYNSVGLRLVLPE